MPTTAVLSQTIENMETDASPQCTTSKEHKSLRERVVNTANSILKQMLLFALRTVTSGQIGSAVKYILGSSGTPLGNCVIAK